MKVLHVISSVNPKGGGPIEVVRQLSEYGKNNDWHAEVACLDDPNESFVNTFTVKVHALGPAKTSYKYTPRLKIWLLENAEKYDVIIINGIWAYNSFGAWRALKSLNKPYFIFTHGMLDPWFKVTYPLKHLKKWLYWPWAEYRVLRDAKAVLFTSEEEKRLAAHSFSLYSANGLVVNYGTKTPPNDSQVLKDKFFEQYPELIGKRVLLFLSRIHEKKGCDLLIEAFAKVNKPADLHLVLAGPDQTGWAQSLKHLTESLNISDQVTWTGMLQGDLKWGAFYASEAFVLPSHQENFGIAVAEALGCGLPVLISNKVNIWREIQQDGAGIVNDDTLEGTLKSLESWLALSGEEQKQMAKQASDTFLNRFTIEAMLLSLRNVITIA